MAKFKVGDKVRCIDASKLPMGEDFYLTSGEVYKVIKEDKRSYRIIANNGMQVWYNKERFEVIKENKMEKTFREVIADIKEGEVWESSFKTIAFKEGKVLIERRNGLSCPYVLIDEKEEFKLQRKEYTFQEAFKAYEEGKEIESVCSECRYKKENGEDVAILSADWQEFDYFELYEIRGKWYIND